MTTVAVSAGFIGLFAWISFHSSEPSYQGKKLSAWLEEARQNGELSDALADIQLDTPAAKAIRSMGEEALPVLIRMARSRDTALRRKVREFWEEHDWMTFRPEEFADIQMKAAYGFLALGPAARPAVSELTSMLNDPAAEVRTMAAFALGKIGPGASNAVPALQKLIQNPSPPPTYGKWRIEDRYIGTYALGQIGPAARPALRQIMALTNDAEYVVRTAAFAAAIRITGDGLGPFVEALKDPSNDVTNWLFAARVMHLAGTNGIPAIPLLIEALQNTNNDVRGQAVQTLGAIHMRPEVCVPALLPLLELTNTNTWTRASALSALRNFGPSAPPGAVPLAEITRCLDDPDQFVRTCATNTLRQLYPEAAAGAGIQ